MFFFRRPSSLLFRFYVCAFDSLSVCFRFRFLFSSIFLRFFFFWSLFCLFWLSPQSNPIPFIWWIAIKLFADWQWQVLKRILLLLLLLLQCKEKVTKEVATHKLTLFSTFTSKQLFDVYRSLSLQFQLVTQLICITDFNS